ncbi:MAG: transglycosylase SLT domain-containing protein [Aquisalinus sp.]|nr:transglycosylase SLT domain-containing protein [Aquisalinus sp.]
MSLTKLTALFLILVTGLSACASTPPSDQTNACAIFAENRSWYRATSKAERKWGVPIEVQLAFIRKESSFDRKARPERGKFLWVLPGKRPSSALGYAQALDGTWEEYRKKTGNRTASRKNFADATDFIGWYVDSSARRAGISRDDAYSQYLAYHEGAGGYMRGSWKRKPEVRRRASVVATMASKYEAQLKRCEGRFRRDIPLVPFI